MSDIQEIQVAGAWKPGYVWADGEWIPEDHWAAPFVMQPKSEKPLKLADLEEKMADIWDLLGGETEQDRFEREHREYEESDEYQDACWEDLMYLWQEG